MNPLASRNPLLVTSALPYANGPIHFGHIAGAYLPADIYVRYQRLLGTDVVYICGTDEHGVSIIANAEKEGLTDVAGFREYTAHWHHEIKGLFDRFLISFDHFSRTSNQDPHYALCQEFFLRLLRQGCIAPHSQQQFYCGECSRFLPDRFVEGDCYECGAENARGDECKACGAWLDSVRLTNPHCVSCNETPELRDTMQFELDLSPFSHQEGRTDHPAFHDWLASMRDRLKVNVRTMVFDKLIEGEGMTSRPITRDLPWGVPLPSKDLEGNPVNEHSGKVLYVWFDAPVGYISATMEWARDVKGDPGLWRKYWVTEKEASEEDSPQLVHFIGKDNIPFHCIVFPAMLGWQGEALSEDAFIGPAQGERWVLPSNVPANEFYNLEGQKFSTSDNWRLDNDHLFESYGVDALRWYLTVSMPETADSHFTFSGLQSNVNSALNDTLGNYASRVLKFIDKHFERMVPDHDPSQDEELQRCKEACQAGLHSVGEFLSHYEFRKAADALVDLGRFGNRLFDETKPWATRESNPATCASSLHAHCQILATLSVVMAPFLPEASERLRAMLALPSLEHEVQSEDRWIAPNLEPGHSLGEPGILFSKIEDLQVESDRQALLDKSE